MTNFEKDLLTGYIIAADECSKMIEMISKATWLDDGCNKADEIRSDIVRKIQKYLESLPGIDNYHITTIMERDIIPQLNVGNYINIIMTIEHEESIYKKEDI